MSTLIGRLIILSLALAAPPWAPWAPRATGGFTTRPPAARPQPQDAASRAPASLVAQLLRADYEGDRAALERLRGEIVVPSGDPGRAARLHYWRGFALWRSAINGVNDAVDPTQLDRLVNEAMRDFETSLAADPRFVDATVGTLSCMQIAGFLNRADPARLKALFSRYQPLLDDSVTAAPDNPRLLWVLGMSQAYAPPTLSPAQIEQRRKTAIATYERGLQLARGQRRTAHDPLDPAWGEPELLMSLAHAYLHQPSPDVTNAER